MPDITPLRQCLVINPDGTTHLVTAHRPADFALGISSTALTSMFVRSGRFGGATKPALRVECASAVFA